jgi:DNA-directed RNA polymerase specialized sigma24 family protein
MITNIVTVVFRIHFYYVTDYDLEMDLKQEGYLKAYSLLAEGNYDPSKNLRTFIYTGVRNAMTNYMYHTRKESHDDLDLVFSQLWQSYKDITADDYWSGKLFYKDDESSSFDVLLVKEVCDKYIMFGDYFDIIINEFNIMRFM